MLSQSLSNVDRVPFQNSFEVCFQPRRKKSRLNETSSSTAVPAVQEKDNVDLDGSNYTNEKRSNGASEFSQKAEVP